MCTYVYIYVCMCAFVRSFVRSFDAITELICGGEQDELGRASSTQARLGSYVAQDGFSCVVHQASTRATEHNVLLKRAAAAAKMGSAEGGPATTTVVGRTSGSKVAKCHNSSDRLIVCSRPPPLVAAATSGGVLRVLADRACEQPGLSHANNSSSHGSNIQGAGSSRRCQGFKGSSHSQPTLLFRQRHRSAAAGKDVKPATPPLASEPKPSSQSASLLASRHKSLALQPMSRCVGWAGVALCRFRGSVLGKVNIWRPFLVLF